MRRIEEWEATEGGTVFRPIAPDEMPRDPDGKATGWTFRPLEHDEMNSPHWIEATDAEGRALIYDIFLILPPDQRPQDDARQTGKGWSFRTLYHDEQGTPHGLEAMDTEGRKAAYVPLMHDGKIGRWIHAPLTR